MELLVELRPKLDGTGNNLTINCPECGQRECSISIQKEGHLWGCFRLKECGKRGNIWDILKSLGKLKALFSEFKANEVDYIDLRNLSIAAHNYTHEIDDLNLEVPDKNHPLGWTRILSNDPYLDQRNFHSYQHCFVGRTNMHPAVKKDYVVFLVKENNVTKGWVGRHTWDKKVIEEYNHNYQLSHGVKNKIKRYRNSDETDFSKLLYGLDDLDPSNSVPVVLVEGIFDKHALDEKLFLTEDPFLRSVATFKCFVSDTQIAKLKLKNVKDIILFYDPDVIRQIQINVKKLEYFFNVKIIISSKNKDPDELSQEEIFEVFENQLYTPEQIKYDFTQLKKLKF